MYHFYKDGSWDDFIVNTKFLEARIDCLTLEKFY
jgi:hypothetical protein